MTAIYLFKALQAIAEGYPFSVEDDHYIIVENPLFEEDNGENPCFVIDTFKTAVVGDNFVVIED